MHRKYTMLIHLASDGVGMRADIQLSVKEQSCWAVKWISQAIVAHEELGAVAVMCENDWMAWISHRAARVSNCSMILYLW